MFPQYKLQPKRQRKCYRFERILNKNLPFHINPATKNASALIEVNSSSPFVILLTFL